MIRIIPFRRSVNGPWFVEARTFWNVNANEIGARTIEWRCAFETANEAREYAAGWIEGKLKLG